MVSIDTARQLALSLPGVTEQPHFHLASFRVNKKIFSTLWEDDKKMMIKLSLIDQSVFCKIDKAVIYPVPGAWGTRGCTFFELSKMNRSILKDALLAAWTVVAPAILKKSTKVK